MRVICEFFNRLFVALIGLALFSQAGWTQSGVKVEVVPQVPHTHFVTAVAFSPSGRLVASGSGDWTIKLWDAQSGRLVRTFLGHQEEVNAVAFSPDGTRLLSASDDKTIKLWDITSGGLLNTFVGSSQQVMSVSFSPDGAKFVSGGFDKMVTVWETATGNVLRILRGHADEVWSVAFSSDGKQIVSGSVDGKVSVWDVATGSALRVFDHSYGLMATAFSPEGLRVASGSNGDNQVRLWDVATGKVTRTFAGQHTSIGTLAFSRDGNQLVTVSNTSKGTGTDVNLWDIATGRLIQTFGPHDNVVNAVAISPDGNYIVSGGQSGGDGLVKLWDAKSGQLSLTLTGPASQVTAFAISPDGTRIISAAGNASAKVWDTASGQLIRTLERFSRNVMTLAYSPDGTRVALAGSPGYRPAEGETSKDMRAEVHVLNTLNGNRQSFVAHPDVISSLTFSSDGGRVLSGSHDKTCKLWNSVSGELISTYVGHTDKVNAVAFSIDGARVLSASDDKTIKLWETASGLQIREFVGHTASVNSVAFSSDGRKIVSGSSDGTIRLWEASGRLVHTLEGHHGSVSSVTFSPDGRHILSGSGDGTLRLWEAESGALIRPFEGHTSGVISVTYSHDSRVISGGQDNTIRVWDIAHGHLLASLMGGQQDDEWLAMTPTGFFAASEKGTDRVLSLVRGLAVTTIGQVQQSLFNPDLVREALGGDLNDEVRQAAKFINLTTVLDSGPAPEVVMTTHRQPSKSSADSVRLGIRVVDRGKGVGRIEWRVNGITARVSRKPSHNGPEYRLTQDLSLDPGDNTIEVVAYNASNLLASLPARTSITFTGRADQIKPKLHILAIGINSYKDRGWTAPGTGTQAYFAPLTLAVKDATTFGANMKQAGRDLYQEVRVTYALDQDAAKANLERILKRLADEIHPRDTFILFAAAHGFSVGGRFYLIPQDYQGGEDPKALVRSAIGQDTLQSWLANRIRAKKAIVLLDTCRSGSLVAGHLRPRENEILSEAAIGRLHEATGRPVLTAAAQGQDAQEGLIVRSGQTHGLFTWALLDALRNGDTNGNGEIALSELVTHVQGLVPQLAAELGATGGTVASVKGSTMISRGARTTAIQQTARFGSRGEDFTLVKRLQTSPQ